MNRKAIVFCALVVAAAAFILFRARGEIIVGGGGGGSTTVVGGNISNTYNFGSQMIVANVTNVALPSVLSNITASGNAPAATNASSYVGSTAAGIGTNTTFYNAITNRGDLLVGSNSWLTGTVTVAGLQTNKLDLRTAFSGNLISENDINASNNVSALGNVTAVKDVSGQRLLFGPTSRFVLRHTNNLASLFDVSLSRHIWNYSDITRVLSLGGGTGITMSDNTTFESDIYALFNSGFNQIYATNLNLPSQAPSRVAVIDGSGNLISDSAITTTELSYLDGLTEALPTSLANKVDESSGVATNLNLYNTIAVQGGGTFSIAAATADRVAYFDGSKNLLSSSTVDSTELGYLDGVTGALQTQLNNRVDELNGLATNLTARGINLPTLTASRGLIVDASGNITNITSASPTTEFVRADGTAAVPAGGSGTPAGNSGAVQFNETSAFAGTNDFIFDRTNRNINLASAVKLGLIASVAQLQSAAGVALYLGSGGSSNWLMNSGEPHFKPVASNANDIGTFALPTRSNWVQHLTTKESVTIGTTLVMVPAASTQLGTNTFADGNLGTIFTNRFNSVASGVTNLYTTNLNDGQKILWWLFPSNGVSVGFPQFAASQYTDGAIIPIATNQWSVVEITRRGNETNINVESGTFTLIPGNGLTITTNFVTREITLNNTANGVYRTIYIDAAAMVSNVTAGATFLTEQTATPTNRMVDSYVFDGANSNIVQFKVALPLEWDAGVVKVKLWTWTTNNVAAMTNVYGLSATAITNGIVMTNADWGVEQTITNVVSSAGGAVQLSPATTPITVLNANVAGSLVWFRLRRIPQNANDNDVGQSKVLGAWVQYKQGATEPSSW